MEKRPLPPTPKGLAVALPVAFVLLAIGIIWLVLRHPEHEGVFLGILFICPFLVIYFYYYRRRCPECKHRLLFRREYLKGTEQYRIMLDCHRCKIAWDTGHTGDDSQ